ncbi:MAG: 50S ribosomal protein L22 [Candidatus Thermoplasmatota archaeon]|nr:50S ribosomal protein L22 [Candidatus Thermoplasmatota archaeon]MCL5730531.1 50S ribosomal protein L22 [Candidatus Thermoplasmatota archaeon]
MKGYTVKEFPEKSANSRIVKADISLKDSVNIAHNLRGMKLSAAKDFAEKVIRKEKPVKYFRYLDSVSHRKGTGPGRYPIKAMKAFLDLLNNVEANAEFKGLQVDSLVLKTVTACKGGMVKRYRPKAYGRAGEFFKDQVNLEAVVVEEAEE